MTEIERRFFELLGGDNRSSGLLDGLKEKKQVTGCKKDREALSTFILTLAMFESVLSNSLLSKDIKSAVKCVHTGQTPKMFKVPFDGVVRYEGMLTATGRAQQQKKFLNNGGKIIIACPESAQDIESEWLKDSKGNLVHKNFEQFLGRNNGASFLVLCNDGKLLFFNLFLYPVYEQQNNGDESTKHWGITFGELAKENDVVRQKFQAVNKLLGYGDINLERELEEHCEHQQRRQANESQMQAVV